MVADNRPNMGNNQQPQRPLFMRILIGIFKFIVLVLVIGIGGVLGWATYQQFQIIAAADRAQDQQISNFQETYLTEGQIRGIVENMINEDLADVDEDISSVEESVDALESTVSDQDNMLVEQLAQIDVLEATQDELVVSLGLLQEDLNTGITGVESTLAEADQTAEQLEEELALRNQSMALVEESLTTLDTQLANLRAEVETLRLDLAAIPTTTVTTTVPVVEETPAEAVTEESAPAVTASPDAVALVDFRYVRLYGLVIRSKIHINEGDLEAATTAIEDGQLAVAELAAVADGALGEALAVVSENLDIAADSLDSKPTLSNIALDDAWTAMDEVLALLSATS